jgi:acetyltransferase-like isoleucine patch superfamily enzyme
LDDAQLTPERFSQMLRACYETDDSRLRREHHRSLPFQDAAFDRWERAARLGFGEGASIYNSAAVYGDVRVGAHTWVGPNTLLDGSGGGLTIGAYCSISSGVQIYTHDTVLWALSGGQLPRAEAAVTIGDCVYIGSGSIIAAGVRIGSRCVVAANSYVNRELADGTIVGGSPARRLGAVVGEGRTVRLVYDERR